jgi:hypothetical protein
VQLSVGKQFYDAVAGVLGAAVDAEDSHGESLAQVVDYRNSNRETAMDTGRHSSVEVKMGGSLLNAF